MSSPRHFEAAYLTAFREGLLAERIERALNILASCTLCPRQCQVNRLEGQKGICGAGAEPEVSSYNPHFGEEEPLVGQHGSGTIFLTHCNLRCSFCQNYDISHVGEGRKISYDRLAHMMLELQGLGCHNINFVTPTHFVPQILKALELAAGRGLVVPLVYNTGGYDSLESLKLLNGVIDIYMPDYKFSDSKPAQDLCDASNYPQVVQEALVEMHRQVGDLALDSRGIAQRGLLVRHLVMPGGLAGTREAMRFLAQKISRNTYVNIMDQYRPCGEVPRHSPIARRITQEEYDEAVAAAKDEGITRLDRRARFRLVWEV